MLTVPEAARRAGRDPETVRRWIRTGKLRAQRVGTQHMIEERDLDSFLDDDETIPIPEEWLTFDSGERQPNWVRIVRQQRREH